MVAIFDPASYEPSWLSLPFVGAGLGLVVMSFYVVLMRGARLLRVAFLCACGASLGCTMGFVLVGSLTEEAAVANAILIYKLGMALLPAAAAAVFAFEVFLVGQLARFRLPVLIACLMALLQAAVMLTTS
ncbi:MAG TPA: hypothetical protein VNM90_08955, partial [Haliangium sp.]|nr:hypothetical protein [Haliangium sp.]